jgi:nicotinate-nucleotide pyrophosphorylase (carboxylating)
MLIPKRILEEKFRRFVEEDIGHGDVTTYYTIPNGTVVTAQIIAKEKGVIAGVKEASIFIESFGIRAKPLV